MRFHIGFSKRISVKKIIEILGFIFIMLLTFFGIYDTTHALSYVSSGSFTTYEYEDLIYNNNGTSLDNVVNRTGNVVSNNTSYGYNVRSEPISYGNNNYGYFINATSSFSNSIRITDYLSYKLDNSSNNICYEDTNDLESVDFYFYLSSTNFGTSNSFDTFYVSNFSDTFNVRIDAINVDKDLHFTTICSKTNVNNSSDYFLITCNNVMRSNKKYTIDYYKIDILNAIPFNNRLLHSNNTEYISINYQIGRMSNYVSPYDKTFNYECSSNKPNLDGGFVFDDDPGGLNDIYDEIKGNYSSNLPGINTKNFVDIPSNFTDLLTLPLDILHAIINNSTGTCESYSIDLSSIVSKWGNVNEHYYLQLPCMREVLSSKLGSLYTLCDLFFCFVIFYNFAMHIVRLLNALTYGEDLFSIFYQPMEPSVMLQSSSAGGSYLRQRQWFE